MPPRKTPLNTGHIQENRCVAWGLLWTKMQAFLTGASEQEAPLFYVILLLGGGFKYVSFSPLFGEHSHFDVHIFQVGWNHQPVMLFYYSLLFCNMIYAADKRKYLLGYYIMKIGFKHMTT